MNGRMSATRPSDVRLSLRFDHAGRRRFADLAGRSFVRFGLLLATLSALASGATAAGDVTLKLWSADLYDLDGDGYAPWNCNSSLRESVSTPDGVVPEGWVEKRGDHDDNDPDVHPRRPEVYANGIDDDCDGKIDEPEFKYYPSGNGNTTDGFTMEVAVNDADVVDAWINRRIRNRLWYKVERQNLNDTGTTRSSGYRLVTDMSVYPSSARMQIELDGLLAGQVIRARVQFYVGSFRSKTAIGEQSDWYYTTTDWNGSVGRARTRLLLQGIYEYYLSEHLGYVGYLGLTYEYGTRYGADPGEAWCSEYCAFLLGPEVAGLGTVRYYNDLIDYFDGYGRYTSVSTASDFVDGANRGDYLAIDRGNGSINHSCLFLAYDQATGNCWTLDGNGTGSADCNTGYETRRGGDEVWIRETPPDDVAGWGKIVPAMLP